MVIKRDKAAENFPKVKRGREAAKTKLAWLLKLPHRRIMDDNSPRGIILYKLPTEYMGHVFRKVGIVPVMDSSKYGTTHRFREIKRGGRTVRHWDLITMTESEALKLAAAIYDLLGVPAEARITPEVQPDRPDGVGAPPTAAQKPLTEKDEIERLMKKFRGA